MLLHCCGLCGLNGTIFWIKRTEDSVSLSVGSMVLPESFSFLRCRSLVKTAQFEHISRQCPVMKRG